MPGDLIAGLLRRATPDQTIQLAFKLSGHTVISSDVRRVTHPPRLAVIGMLARLKTECLFPKWMAGQVAQTIGVPRALHARSSVQFLRGVDILGQVPAKGISVTGNLRIQSIRTTRAAPCHKNTNSKKNEKAIPESMVVILLCAKMQG